ncbi:hypothetical protein BV509_10725 [Rhodovulum sulfidophilum]|uniref:Uncharacterized protein n=1 Tax=Rhodovulum visakhapatnamense TaxID=364297 RepID=A0ABS1RI83_9RHOB|nr:hypothetical protein [Rhodovulum visakhapatnamense]MBL3569114.1 hypothetical protein [Rhodovulum visakhapatnamense]MBL3579338.1 hypothetical protein [Rhodovulum visakhapatnamense]OLS44764.1 hypothetical protein BV509_10725 [Rhodovulum sulfidophilum]
MSDIVELERRIVAALDRIGRGLDGMGRGDDPDRPDPSELEALREALETERGANAQLNERVKALHDRQETQVARLEQRVADLAARAEAAEADVDRLRAVNAKLRETSAALREANAQGLGDPGAIDAAMLAELEALTALRASDRAEIDAILAELMPVAEGGAAHA